MENWQDEYKTEMRKLGLTGVKSEYYKFTLDNWQQDKRTTNGKYKTIWNNAHLLCLAEILKDWGLKAKVTATKTRLEIEYEGV